VAPGITCGCMRAADIAGINHNVVRLQELPVHDR
jgi:hypothetical protein